MTNPVPCPVTIPLTILIPAPMTFSGSSVVTVRKPTFCVVALVNPVMTTLPLTSRASTGMVVQ